MKKLLLFPVILLNNFFYSQTFSGGSGTITDNGQPNNFSITVSGLSSTTLNSSLGLTRVCLDITHSYKSDLRVAIVAPDGTIVNLFSAIGAGYANFIDVNSFIDYFIVNELSKNNDGFKKSSYFH